MEFVMVLVFAIIAFVMASTMMTMFVNYDENTMEEIGINLGR